jgi:serine/threonine protein phosphatase PrpC
LSCLISGYNLTAETYKQTDQEYLKAENSQHRDAGSTASTAVLVGDRLLVANVGDSRAVVCIGGKGDYETHVLLEILEEK